MTRRWLLSALCLLLAPASLWAQDRPNFVLFLCDGLRADSLGCMGHLFAQTPTIDELAFGGVTFENAFTVTPASEASRASIWTGQYPARSRLAQQVMSGYDWSGPVLDYTFLAHLKRAGYQIGYAGKWGAGRVPTPVLDFNSAVEADVPYLQEAGGKEVHLTRVAASQAKKILDQAKDNPFFLTVAFQAPRPDEVTKPPFFPYDKALTGEMYEDAIIDPAALSEPEFFQAQPDFLKRSYNRDRWVQMFSTPALYEESTRGYYRLVSGIDLAVAEVLKALDDHNLRQNTVILFASDHGSYLGARGFAGEWLPHEVSMRIPLIVNDPRQPAESHGRRQEMALTIDLSPTILEMAGVNPPPGVQGRSLFPLIRGDEVKTWRTEFYCDHHAQPHKIPASESIRTVRWKYIRYVNSDPLHEELYDLNSDPEEGRSLIGNAEFRFIHESMEQLWREWRDRIKGDLP